MRYEPHTLRAPLQCVNVGCDSWQTTGDPMIIAQLVFRLAEWHKAWAPGGE